MNTWIGIGRLTRDPEMRQAGETVVARYSLAIDRRFKRDGEPASDFINCVAFGKSAEFAEKYFHKGIKIAVTGHIQTGSYTKQDGTKVYTTNVIVDNQEFVESKSASEGNKTTAVPNDDFMTIPDNVDEELPFS